MLLTARAARREVFAQHVVALEADARDLLEEQGEQRDEVRGLEQVHVKRILEVGRRVRRDDERGAVGRSTRASSATWLDRIGEVLDDVRRHDRVDAVIAHAEPRAVHPREAQVRRRRASCPASTTVAAL